MLVGGLALAGLAYGESLWAAVVPVSAAAVGFAKGLPGVLWPLRRPEEDCGGTLGHVSRFEEADGIAGGVLDPGEGAGR